MRVETNTFLGIHTEEINFFLTLVTQHFTSSHTHIFTLRIPLVFKKYLLLLVDIYSGFNN